MRRSTLLALGLFVIFQCLPARGLDWPSQSLIWDDAQLLPPGMGAWTFSHQSKSVDQRFGEKGRPEIIGRSTKQYQRSGGVTTVREFQMRLDYQRWLPMWAFGISPHWTIMARLPITRINAQSSERIYNEQGSSSTVHASDFHALDAQSSSGLQTPPEGDYTTTRLGQFEVKGKYEILRGVNNHIVSTQVLKFPTAENTKVDFIAFPNPLPSGFATGLGLSGRTQLTGGLSFVYGGEYLYRFEDKVYGRKEDGFPTEDLVTRSPGAEMQAQVGGRYGFYQTYFVQSGLRQQMKQEDHYQDAESPLQGGLKEERQSMYVNLAYVPLSRLQQLSLNGLSFAGQVGWESVLDGRNTEDGDILNLELQVQF